MLCKNRVHEVTREGACDGCFRDRQRRYAERQKMAMRLLNHFEDHGVDIDKLTTNDGYTIVLNWLLGDDSAAIEREHPVLIDKWRRQLA